MDRDDGRKSTGIININENKRSEIPHKVKSRKEVEVRFMEKRDIDGVIKVFDNVYPELIGTDDQWGREHLKSSSEKFPEGHVVVLADEKVVGFSLSFIIDFDRLRTDENEEITEGDGFLDTHDPVNGDSLYISEVVVDPKHQKNGIGTQLIRFQQKLSQKLGLKGCSGASLVPDFCNHSTEHNINEYIDLKGFDGKPLDRNLRFYDGLGFQRQFIREGYVADPNSEGNAVIILWEPNNIDSK